MRNSEFVIKGLRHSEECNDEESPLVDMLTVGEILRYAQNDIPN